MKTRHIVILTACPSMKEARAMAERLLDKRLIACANVIDGVRSFFWWKGKRDKANEALLILKTAERNFKKVEQQIKKLHSYEVPEIIALPIVRGEGNYLRWIEESVTGV